VSKVPVAVPGTVDYRCNFLKFKPLRPDFFQTKLQILRKGLMENPDKFSKGGRGLIWVWTIDWRASKILLITAEEKFISSCSCKKGKVMRSDKNKLPFLILCAIFEKKRCLLNFPTFKGQMDILDKFFLDKTLEFRNFLAGQQRQIFRKSHQAFPPIIGGPTVVCDNEHKFLLNKNANKNGNKIQINFFTVIMEIYLLYNLAYGHIW
jgi:hypothetical protein